MPKYHIALLAGDGIGEEIMRQAVKVLRAVEAHGDVALELTQAKFGASAWFETGSCAPPETVAVCDAADAILKGTVGLSYAETQKIPPDERPEGAALLPMRRKYDTFANFRPVLLPPEIAHFSPLKREIIGDGIDIMIVRELVGGLYFGEKELGARADGARFARETLEYDEHQIRRLVKIGFDTAMRRRKKLHNIHKNNVLKSSVLWCEIVDEVAAEYPQVEVAHLLVDAAATHLCLNPTQFDVMVMENMFGDILSDQAGGILGSLGLMPSACVGPQKSYFEPAHGSAPDIAGQNIANPYAMIGSAAMMLEYSFNLPDAAAQIRRALAKVFAQGYSTPDLSGDGMQLISTDDFGDRVAAEVAAA